MFSRADLELATRTLAEARKKDLRLCTAESCTGGLIAGLLTEIPGSSDVVERGFVTYSNRAKREMLGVAQATLDSHGAVSRQTALEMAKGALARSDAHIAVSVTGIAGPGGGSAEKPVGLVHFATARIRSPGTAPVLNADEHRFGEKSRTLIRLLTVREALRMVRREIGNSPSPVIPGAAGGGKERPH